MKEARFTTTALHRTLCIRFACRVLLFVPNLWLEVNQYIEDKNLATECHRYGVTELQWWTNSKYTYIKQKTTQCNAAVLTYCTIVFLDNSERAFGRGKSWDASISSFIEILYTFYENIHGIIKTSKWRNISIFLTLIVAY